MPGRYNEEEYQIQRQRLHNQILEMYGVSGIEIGEVNEQTTDNGVGDRSGVSYTTGTVPLTPSLDVERANATNGGDTIPVPERTSFTAMGSAPSWVTSRYVDPNQRVRYSIDPATFERTVTVDRPPYPPDIEQPMQRQNELILSDDPVEQYHLTAISFFKGIQAPSGGINRYGRTYRELKDEIINALQSDLDHYQRRNRERS